MEEPKNNKTRFKEFCGKLWMLGYPSSKTVQAAIPDFICAGLFYAILVYPKHFRPEVINRIEAIFFIEGIAVLCLPSILFCLFVPDRYETNSNIWSETEYIPSKVSRIIAGILLCIGPGFAIWFLSKPAGRAWILSEMVIIVFVRIYSFYLEPPSKYAPGRRFIRMFIRFIYLLILVLFLGCLIPLFIASAIGLYEIKTILITIIGYFYFLTMGIFELFKSPELRFKGGDSPVTETGLEGKLRQADTLTPGRKLKPKGYLGVFLIIICLWGYSLVAITEGQKTYLDNLNHIERKEKDLLDKEKAKYMKKAFSFSFSIILGALCLFGLYGLGERHFMTNKKIN